MSLCIVLFCSENRCSLKYSVKDTYHHLLVKLRALLQNSRSVEIFKLEEVGSSLGGLCTKLWRMNLCKSIIIKKIPKAPCDTLLYAERSTLSWVSECHCPVIELCLKRCIQFPFVDLKRHWLRRLR